MADGFGAITLWGFSPALDLQEEISLSRKKKNATVTQGEELNILLVGAGDARHLLKTLAEAYHHSKKKLNFYIVENSIELYARQMLLLSLVTDSLAVVGLQEKTELFLEIFGNILVRSHTYECIQNKSSKFIRMVTDFDYLHEVMPLLSLDNLKYREIDDLERIFKAWHVQDPKECNISEMWDKRVRQHLGVRYDNRSGVYDWDYHMKLAEKDAAIINPQQYYRWRNTGVCFEVREGSYIFPNKTLCSGIVLRYGGEKHVQKGYWGDLVSSPYLAFGLETDDERFFKKENEKYVKSAQDISVYNINKLMYEIYYQKKYIPGVNIAHIENVKSTESVKVDWSKVYFLPIDSIPALQQKEKFFNLFHIVYFSNNMVHHLKPEITSLLSPDATVIIETAKYMLDLRPQHIKEYISKITSMAKAANCELLVPCDPLKDSFARFFFAGINEQQKSSSVNS